MVGKKEEDDEDEEEKAFLSLASPPVPIDPDSDPAARMSLFSLFLREGGGGSGGWLMNHYGREEKK